MKETTASNDDMQRGGALGVTLDEAAQNLSALIATPAAETLEMADGLEAAPNGTISVAGMSTNSQAGAQNTFLRTSDALAFVMSISAGSDLVSAGYRFNAYFQVVEFNTNNVVIHRAWNNNNAFSWGTDFWISLGNNWGPPANYETPAKWGLNVGLYMLRGIVEVVGHPAFNVSAELPFRVR